MEKLEIMIKLASDRNIDQVLLEFKEYATEVDVDFVRKAVRAIGRCAIKLERAAERCISVLLELIKIKVNYVVQEAIIVIKDIFRRYPNTYESIIATLCESLDTLDEPEAKVVLNNATVETDNPDLRDRAYIYWRLLSTDPEAAKDVVLAEKPVITDDSNQLDSSLLDELLANIATLSSVYHKPPEAFVTRVKTTAQKTEDDDYPEGSETGNSESPAHAADGGASSPTSSSSVPYSAARQPAPAPPTPAAPVPDLLGDLIGLDNNAIVPVDQPATPTGPPLPVLRIPASTGQALHCLFYYQNQLAKVPQIQPGTSARTLLPMVMFQNLSQGPPSSLLQVAVKNSQQPVWYFNDKVLLHVFFTEDGRMERTNFLETWRSLPDSNEVSKDFPDIVVNSVEATLDRLTASNMFFIAKRKHANQDVFYFSAKLPQGIPFLIELTTVIGTLGVKCAIKTPSPEIAPIFFEAVETLLKG
uniref:Beta-adaptin appendage C-terminal subdomain domain-containing protein n=1 Tax=Fagus sylvatica TaxID=28930 RepID=A0A2N9FW79_FAGSY